MIALIISILYCFFMIVTFKVLCEFNQEEWEELTLIYFSIIWPITGIVFLAGFFSEALSELFISIIRKIK